MISAFHQLKKKACELGVDEFLEKPFDVKQLVSLVDKHIKNRDLDAPGNSDHST